MRFASFCGLIAIHLRLIVDRLGPFAFDKGTKDKADRSRSLFDYATVRKLP